MRHNKDKPSNPLHEAIEQIKQFHAIEWQIVIDYIENEASLKDLNPSFDLPDSVLAKMLIEKTTLTGLHKALNI